MKLWFLYLMMLCCPAQLCAAYAAFDDIHLLLPTWQQVSGAEAPAIIYRWSQHGPQMALLEIQSRSDQPLTLTMRLPNYQADKEPLRATLTARGQTQLLVPITRFGQRLLRAPLAVSVGTNEPITPTLPLLPLTAFYVSIPAITAQVKAEAVAYTISLRDGMVDLHLRNCSHDIIHADLRLVGWDELVPTPLPRIHLLPGTTIEVVVPMTTPDPGISDAIVEMTNIRFGADDVGPVFVERAQPGDPLRQTIGWYPMPVMGVAATAAGFNPWVLSWKPDGDKIIIRNASPQTITGMLHLRVGDTGINVPLSISPHREIMVDASFANGRRPFVGLSEPSIDGGIIAGPVSTMVPAAIPEHALPVTPRTADHHFNPFAMYYVLERGTDGQAQVTVINASGIAIHAEWAIAGFQTAEQQNPRLHLPAGQSVTLLVPVTRSDVRLPLARLNVWNIRMGADVGTTLVLP